MTLLWPSCASQCFLVPARSDNEQKAWALWQVIATRTQVGLEPYMTYMHGKMRPIRKASKGPELVLGVGLVIARVSKRSTSKPISKSHHCCDSLLDDWPGKTTLTASLDKTKQRPSSKRVAKKTKNRFQNIGQKEISGKQRSANNAQISGLSTQRGHKISPNLSSPVSKSFQDLPRSESPCRPDPFLHK